MTSAPDVSIDPQFACALLLEVDVTCKWGHITASKRQNVIATWKISGHSTDRVLIFVQIWYVLTKLASLIRMHSSYLHEIMSLLYCNFSW
jgi:hypothetical protein